jgi:hypothetical protein
MCCFIKPIKRVLKSNSANHAKEKRGKVFPLSFYYYIQSFLLVILLDCLARIAKRPFPVEGIHFIQKPTSYYLAVVKYSKHISNVLLSGTASTGHSQLQIQ